MFRGRAETSKTRLDGLAEKVEDATGNLVPKLLPLLENLNAMQQELKGFLEVARPKVDVILDNVSHITETAKEQRGTN